MKLEITEQRISDFQKVLEKIANRPVSREETTKRLKQCFDYWEIVIEKAIKDAKEEAGITAWEARCDELLKKIRWGK